LKVSVEKPRQSRRPFLTLPLAPRGKICSLGGLFTPSFTSRAEHTQLFRRMVELYPQG
jgi:hypothetical protein